jgi:hypothetical protein
MSPLEERYRRLLRVLPRWYRAQREDEMVTTLLAGRRDPDDRVLGRPGWAETRAVLGLAVTTRVAARHGTERALALGRILRLTAFLGLTTTVPSAINGVADVGNFRLLPELGLVIFSSGRLLIDLLASASLVLLFTPFRRAARLTAVGALVLSAVTVLLASLPNSVWLEPVAPVALAMSYVPLWVAIGSMLVAFTREAPALPVRPWLIVATALAGLSVALTLGMRHGVISPGLGAVGLWAVLPGAAAFTVLRNRVSDLGTWASALALTAGAYIPLVVVSFVYAWQLGTFEFQRQVISAAIPLAILTGAVMALGAIGVRRYRRLAAPSTPAPRRSK